MYESVTERYKNISNGAEKKGGIGKAGPTVDVREAEEVRQRHPRWSLQVGGAHAHGREQPLFVICFSW